MNIIAIDFGGTMIKIGLFIQDDLVKFSSIKSNSDKPIAETLLRVQEKLNQMLTQLDMDYSAFSGVSIALPGIVNSDEKKLIAINEKYNDAITMDFYSWVKVSFKLPLLVMENDANAALMGEYAQGNTDGSKNAVLMILGTGVGSAAMINGSLLRGAHYQAGCLGGHIIVDYSGSECTCGNRGCLEAETATWAVSRIAQSDAGFNASTLSMENNLEIKHISDHARRGDPLAVKILYGFIKKWSAGIINLIHAYDPEVVVLSGGVMKSADMIRDPLFKRVKESAWTPYGEIKLKVSQNPEQSVLFGLNYLARRT